MAQCWIQYMLIEPCECLWRKNKKAELPSGLVIDLFMAEPRGRQTALYSVHREVKGVAAELEMPTISSQDLIQRKEFTNWRRYCLIHNVWWGRKYHKTGAI